MASYELVFKKSVAKDLRGFPKQDVKRIMQRIRTLAENGTKLRFVILAQAGIQSEKAAFLSWIPACAGMTEKMNTALFRCISA